MSQPRYTKHKKWVGKTLSLYINGGDRTVKDGEVLVGSHWQKFCAQGFLVRLPDEGTPTVETKTEEKPQALQKADRAPDKVPGSGTRSPADKVAAASSKKVVKVAQKREPKPEPEKPSEPPVAKSEPKPEPEAPATVPAPEVPTSEPEPEKSES